MAKGGRKGAPARRRITFPNYKIIYKERFTGRVNIVEPWIKFMDSINIRMYYGGQFVTKKNKTTYEPKHADPSKYGIALRVNVEEVCFFEFAYWIKSDLGFNDVGEIWYRKKGCSLQTGRTRIESDKDIPGFLEAPESDGFYHLYVVHKEKEGGLNKNIYGPGVGFYTDSEDTNGGGSYIGSNEIPSELNNSKGGPQTQKVHDSQLDNPRSDSNQVSLHTTDLHSQIAATNIRTKLPLISAKKKSPTPFIDLRTPPNSTSNNPSVSQTVFLRPQHNYTETNPNNNEFVVENQIPEQPPLQSEPLAAVENQIPDQQPIQSEPLVAVENQIPDQAPLQSDSQQLADPENQIPPKQTPHESNLLDSDGSDVCLSDLDIEDRDDDDLFEEFVDHDIEERVTRSLGVTLGNDNENDNADGGEIGNDEDLVDSDDDALSVVGSDDEGNPIYPEFNPDIDFKGKVVLKKGLKFPSNKVFRRALQYHAIDHGYDYYFLHNNNSRVSAYCAKRCNCPWKRARILECKCNSKRKCRFKIHCRKLKGEATWQIKGLRLKHICGHQNQNSKITSQYLAERYLEDWRDDPNWKLSAFTKRARRECKVEINYYMAYYARDRAFRMIFGDAKVEYEKVFDYAAAILKYNPGSTCVVKVDGVEKPQPVFQRLYVCLSACKEGFIAGCRPIIGVDGAHLKGAYPGILLTAVGKDGNNNIFPVAWAVVEVENADTWAWFLELLRSDIASVADKVTWLHEADELTYMSDRQKGLLDAFEKVMPTAETRYCCRHIWSNFKKKFPGTIFKEPFWKAARSTTEHHFKKHMEEIKELSQDAYNYLQAIPPAHWSRHKFSTSSKSGMLLNNCCESFNNVLREARTKPILQLMEWVRRYVMGRFFSKKEGLKAFTGVIMPSVQKLVHRGLQQVSNMRVNQADLNEFEVDDTEYTYAVNLEVMECTCNRWTLMGIPCWHAIACIQKKRLDMDKFIHQAYHVQTYSKAYAPSFRAMPGHHQWEVTPYPRPLPPPHRTLPGRPSSKKRKKEAGEDQEKKNVKRAKQQNKCSNCGGLGHYKNKCPSPLIQKEKKKPGRPKKHAAPAGPSQPNSQPITLSAPPLGTQN